MYANLSVLSTFYAGLSLALLFASRSRMFSDFRFIRRVDTYGEVSEVQMSYFLRVLTIERQFLCPREISFSCMEVRLNWRRGYLRTGTEVGKPDSQGQDSLLCTHRGNVLAGSCTCNIAKIALPCCVLAMAPDGGWIAGWTAGWSWLKHTAVAVMPSDSPRLAAGACCPPLLLGSCK